MKWLHWCLLIASFPPVYYILNSNLINYVSNSTVEDASYAKTNHQHCRLSTIHLAFGLSGNHPGFLSEFEVALKSVLLHAPLDRNMHVHIVAIEMPTRAWG